MTLEIPAEPRVTARIGRDSTGELTVDGVHETIHSESTEEVRETILARVNALAAQLGHPVRVTTDDEEGRWILIVHPNGDVTEGQDSEGQGSEIPSDSPAPARMDDEMDGIDDADRDPFPANLPASVPEPSRATSTGSIPVSAASSSSLFPLDMNSGGPANTGSSSGGNPGTNPGTNTGTNTGTIDAVLPEWATEPAFEQPPRTDRESFLAAEITQDRATKGFRGFLAAIGMPVRASARELAEREEIRTVSQHWAGPRTIAIVNGKGGANKTPTTALLAALFARNGGAGVLAWDNNETRGTLGWRTEQGMHDATVQTLLPNAEYLLSSSAQLSDLAHFVHHQTGDKYDVLRSNPTMLATEQRIDSDDFDRLHAVAAKYFRLVFVDSGNDESAERWLRMIDHTDQLVIATTALGEHAEAGALLLEALAQRDERSAELASRAVVIVSQSERTGSVSDAKKVAAGFEPLARRTVTIPFDTAMHGGKLTYDSLAPATQRAWLRAAAAVAEGL